MQKRNGRKCFSIIKGLNLNEKELKKFVKSSRKVLSCNGHINKDDKDGIVVIFQGDHRQQLKQILIDQYEYDEDDIVLHGV